MYVQTKLARSIDKYILAISILLATAVPVVAETYAGKYGGSSKYWRPEYVGTIQLQASGSKNFTAVMDVELQLKPDSDPNPTTLKYELRGQISFTSPIITKTVNEKGTFTSTCTPISPVPLNISDSGMKLYRGAKGDRYEIKAYQYIRDSKCVVSDRNGTISQSGESRVGGSIGFNSSDRQMTAADRKMNAIAGDDRISDADLQQIDKMAQAGQATINHPAMQQEIAKMQQEEEEFQRTGKKPNAADRTARMNKLAKLAKSGAFSTNTGGGMSSMSPEFQQQTAKITEQSQKISEEDEAQRTKAPDLSRLQGSFSNETEVKDYKTKTEATWDLRRVNSGDRSSSPESNSKPNSKPNRKSDSDRPAAF
jgi:hypothetical protein